MSDNLKTFSFFVIIAALCTVPYLHKKIKKGMQEVHSESENARELYTGKTRAVYNPLDTAYVVTDELKQLITREDTRDFSSYKEWPVISILMDPRDLHDETRGLFKNTDKKGRLWERASHFNYYENGKRKFSSFAGVRIHGGASRGTNTLKSLRFYFRKTYGEDSFLKNLEISQVPNVPVKRLVLRRDTVYHFANHFSYSMIKALGGMAPSLKHVAVYINGEFFQFMQMQEQLHEEQASYTYGHEHFLYYKLKGNNPVRDRLLYENAIHLIKGSARPISFEKMNKLFDLENVTANILAITYFAMYDWAQGVWTKDLEGADQKWKLISWDFDFAFTNLTREKKKPRQKAWEMDGFNVSLNHHDASLRSRLFNRLIKESPEYREYFGQQVDKLFDDILNEEFLTKQFAEYEALAKDTSSNEHMLKSIQAMKDFIKYRKPFFCKQMQNALGFQADTCSRLKSEAF